MRPRRILYGVVGSGLGHAMRAQVMAEHLRASGHSVLIASSGRALSLLQSRGFECVGIRGLDFAFSGEGVNWGSTFSQIVKTAPAAVRANLTACRSVMKRWRPDAIVTDFESLSALVGNLMGVPVISLDHQHVIDRCDHPREVVDRVSRFRLLRTLCAAKTFSCASYIVSSFFFPAPKLNKPTTTLVGPILRPGLEACQPSRDGGHVLVYQTSDTSSQLLTTLHSAREHRFIVYGLHRDERSRNVELRSFDQRRFIDDLASASAVIVNGGFTTIGEALALGKPVLAVPLRGQAEQELNAAWVAHLGVGHAAHALTEAVVERFLAHRFDAPLEPRLRTGRRDACQALATALESA